MVLWPNPEEYLTLDLVLRDLEPLALLLHLMLLSSLETGGLLSTWIQTPHIYIAQQMGFSYLWAWTVIYV